MSAMYHMLLFSMGLNLKHIMIAYQTCVKMLTHVSIRYAQFQLQRRLNATSHPVSTANALFYTISNESWMFSRKIYNRIQ